MHTLCVMGIYSAAKFLKSFSCVYNVYKKVWLRREGAFQKPCKKRRRLFSPLLTTQPFSVIQLGSICAWVGWAPELNECWSLAIFPLAILLQRIWTGCMLPPKQTHSSNENVVFMLFLPHLGLCFALSLTYSFSCWPVSPLFLLLWLSFRNSVLSDNEIWESMTASQRWLKVQAQIHSAD